MGGNRTALFLCMLMLFILRVQVMAAPTTLNIIPTADVLPAGVANLDFQFLGTNTSSGYELDNELQTQFGIGSDAEAGIDWVVNPGGAFRWNGKYRIYEETEKRPAVAVGVQNIEQMNAEEEYIACFKSINKTTRFHFGLINTPEKPRIMLGLDSSMCPLLVFQADYIQGPENFATLGIVLNPHGIISINIAYLAGNSADAGSGYQITTYWIGKVW